MGKFRGSGRGPMKINGNGGLEIELYGYEPQGGIITRPLEEIIAELEQHGKPFPFGTYFGPMMGVMSMAYEKGPGDRLVLSIVDNLACIVPFQPRLAHPAETGRHYGAGVFEGGLAFYELDHNGELTGRIILFNPYGNAYRIQASLSQTGTLGFPVADGRTKKGSQYKHSHDLADRLVGFWETVVALHADLIPHMPNSGLYLRHSFEGITATLGVKPSRVWSGEFIVSPSGPYYSVGNGMPEASMFTTWLFQRVGENSVGSAKMKGNYAGSTRAAIFAKYITERYLRRIGEDISRAADQVIYFRKGTDDQAMMEEAGANNIGVLLYDKTKNHYELLLPDFRKTDTILHSETSKTVLRIQDYLASVISRGHQGATFSAKLADISYGDLMNWIKGGAAVGMLGFGTAAGATSITELFHFDLPESLNKRFMSVLHGKLPVEDLLPDGFNVEDYISNVQVNGGETHPVVKTLYETLISFRKGQMPPDVRRKYDGMFHVVGLDGVKQRAPQIVVVPQQPMGVKELYLSLMSPKERRAYLGLGGNA